MPDTPTADLMRTVAPIVFWAGSLLAAGVLLGSIYALILTVRDRTGGLDR